MPEVASNEVTKIYENTQRTVKARIDKRDVDSIEEVTFKFLKDGEQFEEKTIPISEGNRYPERLVLGRMRATRPAHRGKARLIGDAG